MTDPAGPPSWEKRLSLRSRIELGTAVVALVAALASGIFGLVSQQAKTEAQGQAAASDQQVDTTTSQVKNLQRQLDEAQKQIADLENRLSDPGTTADPGTSSDSTVFHAGPLNLAEGKFADLDAPASDPQWGTLDSAVSGADLYWTGSQLTVYPQAVFIDGSIGYDKCKNTTGYESGDFAAKYLQTGAHFCVYTGDKRYSAVTISRGANGDDALQLKIVTYASVD